MQRQKASKFKRVVVLVIAFALLLGAIPTTATMRTAETPPMPGAYGSRVMVTTTLGALNFTPLSDPELRVLELVNIERARYSLNPLRWCAHLGAAAREHSEDMAAHNDLFHNGSDGSTPWDRMERIGIRFSGTRAENVAAGQQTPEAVVASWMNSEGHRQNILNPGLTYLGVGLVQTTTGWRFFWTQKFGGGTRTVIRDLPTPGCECVHCAECGCAVAHSGAFADGDGINGAPWRLYGCGLLVVDSGFIHWEGELYEWQTHSPWRIYRDYIYRIVFTGPITAGTYLRGLFANLSLLTGIEGLTYFDTSGVSDMLRMFSGSSGLTELDVSNWDTSGVTDMSWMFSWLSGLTELDVSNWDTSGVTNMSHMFNDASSLTELDVSNWDTSGVTNMSHMFSGASSLTELDVSNWDTSGVTYMYWMFRGASSLTEIDVSNWDTSGVTYMSWMFGGASSLTELDVSNWDTSGVTDMRGMFNEASGLTKLDISNWDISSVTNMSMMFSEASGLTELDVSNWDTSGVRSMSWMFSSASGLTGLDVSNWDTSSVTDMSGMFNEASSLTELDVSNWDTSSVMEMSGMFNGATNIRQLTLGENFNVIDTWQPWNQQYVCVNLPEPPANTQFTGLWQNVGTGTPQNPQGEHIFTSAELVDFYHTPGFADTWVWQRTSPYAAPAAPHITNSNAPTGTIGITYGFGGVGFQFSATGYPEPMWSFSGTLPPGLSLNSQGLLSGTPTEAGHFRFIVTASNGINPSASRNVTVTILEPTLSVSTAFADPEDEVQVQIRLDSNPGFASMFMRIAFPDELTLVSYDLANDGLLSGFRSPSNLSSNYVFMGWADTSNIYYSGTLITLTFAVDSQAANGRYPITITFENAYDGEEVPRNMNRDALDIQIRNGAVRVQPVRIGDVDGDGRVTSFDASLLARWLIGQNVDIDLRAANVTCSDGEPTAADLTHLVGVLVGHFPTMCPYGGCPRCE